MWYFSLLVQDDVITLILHYTYIFNFVTDVCFSRHVFSDAFNHYSVFTGIYSLFTVIVIYIIEIS